MTELHRSDEPVVSGALARVSEVIEQLDALELRVAGASSREVEIGLLERATELTEEASRLLETLAREVS